MKSLSEVLRLATWVVLFMGCVTCRKPTSVNIGAVFSYDSVIGRVAKRAIDFAVSDINEDPTILNGIDLNFIPKDANCSVFLGSMDVFRVLEQEVVAIIGPQSSAIAHMLAQIAGGLQVPLVSYATTDPTLSTLQFPYFLRMTHSDAHQMTAMANLIEFYGWKEVIVLFVDSDYGRNGIAALEDELETKSSRVTNKLALPIQFNTTHITELLKSSIVLGPRVYIVHVDPDPALRIFEVAKSLQMMTSDYVWFATDWLSTTLDSQSSSDIQTSLSVLQGVVALRQHIPESARIRAFVSRWNKTGSTGVASSELNVYGLYAYDTVWTVAYSIDTLIKEHKNFSFAFNDKLVGMETSKLQLGKLKVFDGGATLLEKLLETNFTGLTGNVRFGEGRNIISHGYDVINVNETEVHTVGFWSINTGLSISPPETKVSSNTSYSILDQKLDNVSWPGGGTEKPRGWVIAVDEKPMRIVVPNRTVFVDFVTENTSTHEMYGYTIDVFLEACKLIPYEVPYKFIPFGDGISNPNYDQLVKMVSNDEFDAAVGDITIVKNRTEIVDFCQPFASTGLVVVAPISHPRQNAWVFLEPFTWELWCVTAASFLVIAVVIWTLEHRVNEDFRGPPTRQLSTMFLFSFSTLFKTNQEETVSTLGRMVMVVWLFLLLVISSSYTASLTSILTVQQLTSPITGMDTLIATNLPIGYQVGSFVYDYLTEVLYVPSSRLVLLHSPEEFERALRLGPYNGGVAAIIDELPYIELFLSDQTDFGIIGPTFTRSGWGFAFKKESPLAVDMSNAILKLSESGKLSEIYRKWLCKMGCPGEKGKKFEPNQLHLISFWGLYLLCGGISLAALFVFLLRLVFKFVRYKRRQANLPGPSSSARSSNRRLSGTIQNFIEFVDEKEEAMKRMFSRTTTTTQAQAS